MTSTLLLQTFDVGGRLARTLVNERMPGQRHDARFGIHADEYYRTITNFFATAA